jgi:hypothetical protein
VLEDPTEFVQMGIEMAGGDPERLEALRRGLDRLRNGEVSQVMLQMVAEDDRQQRSQLVVGFSLWMELFAEAHRLLEDHLRALVGPPSP